MIRLKQIRRGMVYAMTNQALENRVIAFQRDPNGMLTRTSAYKTGGMGTGTTEVSSATPNDGVDPLASQGSLCLSRDGRFLFAVNAGSSNISCFRVAADGSLTLADVAASGGMQPNSITSFSNMIYVSNVGSAANNFNSNITGFTVANDGKLTMIPASTRKLSTPNAQPACVVFSPGGRLIVVSELTTNRLCVFSLNRGGTLTGPTVHRSAGSGPFGLNYIPKSYLLAAEAGTNALSSYLTYVDRRMNVVSASIPNGQLATCWVSSTPDSRFAYTSNTGSKTITGYRINPNGSLALMESILSTPDSINGAPTDNCVSRDGRYLYALNGNNGTLSVFHIENNGSLVRLQVLTDTDLPRLGSQGIAVR